MLPAPCAIVQRALERDQRPAVSRRQHVLLNRRLEMIAVRSQHPARIARSFDKFRRHRIAGDPQLHRVIIDGISNTENFSDARSERGIHRLGAIALATNGSGLMLVAERLREAPGIENVALSTGGPMGGFSMIRLYMQDGSEVPRLDKRDASWNAARLSSSRRPAAA